MDGGRENKAPGWMDEAETFGWFIVVRLGRVG